LYDLSYSYRNYVLTLSYDNPKINKSYHKMIVITRHLQVGPLVAAGLETLIFWKTSLWAFRFKGFKKVFFTCFRLLCFLGFIVQSRPDTKLRPRKNILYTAKNVVLSGP